VQDYSIEHSRTTDARTNAHIRKPEPDQPKLLLYSALASATGSYRVRVDLVPLQVLLCVSVSVCVCLRVWMCIYACVYVRAYVCMRVYACVCVSVRECKCACTKILFDISTRTCSGCAQHTQISAELYLTWLTCLQLNLTTAILNCTFTALVWRRRVRL